MGCGFNEPFFASKIRKLSYESILQVVFYYCCKCNLDCVWIKKGYNKDAIWRVLSVCGYDRSTWNMEQQVKVDECMLSQDFIFIDSPYGEQGSICTFFSNKELPSCRFLENSRQ
jgi:hypothetical protein